MNRPRLIRGLRIAWAVAWGIFCVLLIVLWVRSWSRQRDWSSPVFEVGDFAVYSMPGVAMAVKAEFVEHDPTTIEHVTYFIPFRYQSIPGELWIASPRPGPTGFSAGFWSWSCWIIQIPYWFATLFSALAAAIGSPLSNRFSLRTMLITTTLIAIVLGLVVWASR